MATPTIKSTYTLDLDTIRALEDMARRLGVSKSEALRPRRPLGGGQGTGFIVLINTSGVFVSG